MATPENMVRTNIVWNLGEGETAVNSLHFWHEHHTGNNLDWAGDMTQRYANLVRDGLESVFPTLKSRLSQLVQVQRIDAYHLGTDGKALDKATALPTTSSSLTGTATGGVLPLEVALVVSLYGYGANQFTHKAKQKRGRFYLPGVAVSSLTNDGRLNDPQGMATIWANFVDYVQWRKMDSLPADSEAAHLVVFSRLHGSAFDVTDVRVDDLFDVQKRRQRQLSPTVKWAHVVPSSPSSDTGGRPLPPEGT